MSSCRQKKKIMSPMSDEAAAVCTCTNIWLVVLPSTEASTCPYR